MEQVAMGQSSDRVTGFDMDVDSDTGTPHFVFALGDGRGSAANLVYQATTTGARETIAAGASLAAPPVMALETRSSGSFCRPHVFWEEGSRLVTPLAILAGIWFGRSRGLPILVRPRPLPSRWGSFTSSARLAIPGVTIPIWGHPIRNVAWLSAPTAASMWPPPISITNS